tara:strand:+ start:177 stop:407 length:231 start_codon:yes stop_codon:yes gene_type:complete
VNPLKGFALYLQVSARILEIGSQGSALVIGYIMFGGDGNRPGIIVRPSQSIAGGNPSNRVVAIIQDLRRAMAKIYR